MVQKKKKILGEERRKFILQLLANSESPITGTELAEKANVSRQVIVQDISLLKAKNHSIIATSQGYIYLKPVKEQMKHSMTLACKHTPEETEEELLLLVKCNVTVKNVIVEHPVYGDLTASLMIKTEKDVHEFMQKMRDKKASLLSELTDGVHLHTIESEHKSSLLEAEKVLKHRGFLLSSTE